MAKPIILLIYSQNVNNVSLNTAEPISSHTHWIPYIMSISTSFRLDLFFSGPLNLFNRSDLPLSDHKKIDEELISGFLWRGICCGMDIKDFLPKQTSLSEYIWEVVVCIMITGKGHLDPDIW